MSRLRRVVALAAAGGVLLAACDSGPAERERASSTGTPSLESPTWNVDAGAGTSTATPPTDPATTTGAPTGTDTQDPSAIPTTRPPTTAPPIDGATGTAGPEAGERVLPDDVRYDFASATRERITLLSERDDDRDGKPDAFVLDIIRPAGASDVPVILEQSPYWSDVGRGILSETITRDADGVATRMPLWYDNWFVPQGYAFAAIDAAGMGEAGGCPDFLGPASRAGAVAALDYLSGKATGTTSDGATVSADWSSGSVAMVGKSADAYHALAAAGTGHEALKAVVVVGALPSAWDYQGGVMSPPQSPWTGGPECDPFVQEVSGKLGDGSGPSPYMRDNDVLHQLDTYRAPTLFSHGLRDLNTRSQGALAIWRGLDEQGVDTQLWLHQGGHTDPFDVRSREWVDTVTVWFDHYLRGAPLAPVPPVSVQRPDLSWQELDELPSGADTTYALVKGHGLEAGAEPAAGRPVLATVQSYPPPELDPNKPMEFDLSVLSDAADKRHAPFVTAPLEQDTHLVGEPTLQVRVRGRGIPYGVAAALVVYGEGEYTDFSAASTGQDVRRGEPVCWGQGSAADQGCFPGDGLKREPGTIDVLTVARHGIGKADWTEPSRWKEGAWVDATLRFGPVDTVVPAGHRVGVVLSVNDPMWGGDSPGSFVDVGPGTLTLPQE